MKFRINTKLLSIFGISFLILIGSVMVIMYNSSTKILIKDKMELLSTIETTKHLEIKNYLRILKNEINALSSDFSTLDALNQLESSFNNISSEFKQDKKSIYDNLRLNYKTDFMPNIDFNIPGSAIQKSIENYMPKKDNAKLAQYMFISSTKTKHKELVDYNNKFNSIQYMQVHKKFHNIFYTYLKTFDLYDMFLISKNGDIVYSVEKERDFATNLFYGPYKDTGLSNVFLKAVMQQKGEIAFEDFTPYTPSGNIPAAFIAMPIYDNNQVAGVLAFQMPIKALNNIVSFYGKIDLTGLGKTGDCYLVGEDLKARTKLRFSNKINNDFVQKYSTVGMYIIDTVATRDINNIDRSNIKKTKVHQQIMKNHLNKEVLSVSHIVNIYDTAFWTIVVEDEKSEVLEPIIDIRNRLFTIISFISIVIFILSYLFINKIIISPLEKFQVGIIHFFDFLKGDEKHIKFLEYKSSDEIGVMTDAVNRSIKDVAKDLNKKEDIKWIKEGIGQLNTILASTLDPKELANQSLDYIELYTQSHIGLLYIFCEDKQNLQQYASFAIDQKVLTKNFDLGVGIVGEVGKTQNAILLKHDIKNVTITLGTKEQVPQNLYVYPLVYQNNLYGVIEIGKSQRFSKKEIEFFDATSKLLAVALSSALQNDKVQLLLDDSIRNNEMLAQGQQKLEEANTKMEEQQQQLEESNNFLKEQQYQLKVNNEELEKSKLSIEAKAKEIEQASKYKTEFLSNMSHELRTPLNAIILLSQLLSRNSKLEGDEQKKATTIFSAGNELLNLINDILDLSKVESGKMDIVIDNFNSSTFLEYLNNLFIESAKENGVEFITIDNYNGILTSDRNRISQIVKNLVSNALKFTKDGSVTVSIDKVIDDNFDFKITVTDTGVGIPQDKQDKIFEAFVQADGTTSREFGGTGLGLSITRQFTTLLKGDISIESQINKGSSFIVTLPNLKENDQLSNPQKCIEEEIYKAPTIIHSKELGFVDDREIITKDDKAILVIDDDTTFAEIAYQKIKHYKDFALTAITAKEGFTLLEQHNICGILLDLTLPDMDGIEVLKRIKNNEQYKDIPIHIISSKDKDDGLIKLGAVGFQQKPILEEDIEDILTTLDNFIKDVTNNTKDENLKVTEDILQDIDLEDINILIVDDNIKNIFVLDSALQEYDANTFIAYNGKDALEILNDEDDKIDIILMDIMMPTMDGYETIKNIRANKDLKHIPIIAITANSMKEDKEKCIEAGADDFVSKPINTDTLIPLIGEWSKKEH